MPAKRRVFILKNHNDVFLAQHDDFADLVSEREKYETWTGNETRIEIVWIDV